MSNHTRYVECYACGAENSVTLDPSSPRDEWLRGYACALAVIMREHHEAQPVCDALGSIGGYATLKAAGAEEHDLAAIRVAMGRTGTR